MGENNGNSHNDRVDWTGVIEKLDTACQKAWQEDRVSAIPLQAAANEIKIASQHAEQLITAMRKSLQEQREMLQREYETLHEHEKANLRKQLDRARQENASLQEDLLKASARIDSLFQEIKAKEEETLAARETYMRVESERGAAHAKKLDELIGALEAKDREREAAWKQRQAALDAEFKQRREELEKSHKDFLQEISERVADTRRDEERFIEFQKQFEAEFQQRELKLREEADSLRRQAEEHAQKRGELESLKVKLQAEISELTRRYKPGKE